MSRRLYPDGQTQRLDEGWSLVMSEPGVYTRPSELAADLQAVAAPVPGTAAAALEKAGRFDRTRPEPLIDKDIWYRRSLSGEAPGPAILRFAGLATIAEIFLNDRLILSCESMFESHDVAVELTGNETLFICFRALKPHLEKPGPRARWRPRLMSNQGLRHVRTTVIGFMPGWSPEIHAVGPWRPITLIRPSTSVLSDFLVSADLTEDRAGLLCVRFDCKADMATARLVCGGEETGFARDGDVWAAQLRIPDIEPWWPHTHGRPSLYDVTLRIGEADHLLARTGFRRAAVDRGVNGDDFAVLVNGERIFCRGAVWTAADMFSLPGDRHNYEPWLLLAKQAGMNMIRLPGIGVYESADFFALCDELGLMVWQDLMFANFDYPVSNAGFMIHVKSEIDDFLAMTQASTSLAVLCGGSEVYQQGAMLGLPERIWKSEFFEETVPAIVAGKRPELPYVANSPSGGQLPFYPNAGVAHYYGVGAYQRPLEDARRAGIRFAAECLAFSNLSWNETLSAGKAGIPRDAGADWDFEDVRDHYLAMLYDVEPQELRRTDPKRYLALSRAVTAEVMEATFAEWRRPGSTCGGALTFTLQDVMAGPGWGVLDVDGNPKPAWYALQRAFRPIQILLADEGTNGLDVHLLNETEGALAVRVELTCLRDGRVPVVSGKRDLTLAARGSASIASIDLFGAFFDTNYAYRFGPPSHDVTVARLVRIQDEAILSEAFHFPLGRAQAMHQAAIGVELRQSEGQSWLELSTDVLAQSVSIDCRGYRPSENGFHLAPGHRKSVVLHALADAPALASGSVRSLGGRHPTIF